MLRKEWTLNKCQTVSVGGFAFLIFTRDPGKMGAMGQMTQRVGYFSCHNEKRASAAQFLSPTTRSTQSYGKAGQVIVKRWMHMQ